MRFDYHTHSTYSDGSFLVSMCRAAEEAGLSGIGVTDHCNVSADPDQELRKHAMGFNLDLTYERRREAIEALRERLDVRVFDAVEMDYRPEDAAEITDFLDVADFDYTIGSVHYLDGVNVHAETYFAGKSEAERVALVDDYYDRLVALADSGLFDVAAHIDLVERNAALRGLSTEEQYHRVAAAFERSGTVPEINAGRILADYGELHPAPEFFEVLSAHDVAFTLGTDSHDPAEIPERKAELEEFVAASGLDVVEIAE